MKYDLYRVTQGDGYVHYEYVANDEHKQRMLKEQANGAPTEWVWSCEAATAEEANWAVTEHMDANDWKL